MAERAHLYLGNLFDPAVAADLQQQVIEARQHHKSLDVELTLEDNRKGRIHAHATTGESIGIIKDRDHQLKAGDLFQTESGKLVQIYLQQQRVLAIQVNPEAHPPALALIHLGHTLGNHHYPIVIQDDKIYVRLEDNANRVEAIIRSANIPGLRLTYEQRSADQAIAFESSSHGHSHPHDSSAQATSPYNSSSQPANESEPSHAHSPHR